MVVGLAGRAAFCVPTVWSDIDLTAENRLDSTLSRLVMENHA